MDKAITLLGITTALLGFAPAVLAQSATNQLAANQSAINSATALQGVQARSIQLQPTQPEAATPNVPSTNSPLASADPSKPPIVVSQPNDRTQIVISPVTITGPLELGTNSAEGAGLTGNNKVQLIYELDQ